MSLINDLKNELITQKNILEQKGIAVNTEYNNPSITEITTAISNIDMDFDPSIATATPEDVLINKTFYAGNTELKTGTYDPIIVEELREKLSIMVSGVGKMEIFIPTETKYNRIQEYAYAIYNGNTGMYYKDNLTIPDNILQIGSRGFYKANITGTLIIPSSCEVVATCAFQYTNISELIAYNGVVNGYTYVFADCPYLKKITLYAPISYLSTYVFADDTALEEIYLPETITNINSTAFMNDGKLKLVKFTREDPCSIPTGTFSYSSVLNFLVPYKSYDKYYTATNYQYYNTPQYGYGDFTIGTIFPRNDSYHLYTITWYETLEDAQAGINAITTCPETGTYYSAFTPIEDDLIDDTIT